jgi:signal transduction histidine kinase
MLTTLQKKARALWASATTIGVDDSGDTIEQKRIRIIDIISFLCLPIIVLFAILSLSAGHHTLTWFYVSLFLLIVIMLFGNYKRLGENFRIVIIILITLLCALASILFDNGQEYYILLITFLSVLFYGLRKGVLYLSLSYAALYLVTEIIKLYISPVQHAPNYIKISNIIISVSILVYFLYDIKRIYLNTLEEAINKRKNLEEYNALLVQQAINLELKTKDIEELKNKNEELSSIVYHQLRSPVVAFSDMLSQYIEYSQLSKEEFLEISKLTQKKVTDTLHVIDNLLMWNRKGIDGIQPHALKFEVSNIINKAVEQLTPLLEKKDLSIIYPGKNHMYAYADADHVLIILLNILTNAIKFSTPGEDIKIDFVELTGSCQVHISNNGKGIERGHLQTIFSTLRIISYKGTMNETGTGLGLKICKNLVEKNNGSIDIKSEANDITTIIIELPTGAGP